jgi:hypothetical protein
MNSTADIKAGEEVMLTDVTRRIDAIVELLQRSPPPQGLAREGIVVEFPRFYGAATVAEPLQMLLPRRPDLGEQACCVRRLPPTGRCLIVVPSAPRQWRPAQLGLFCVARQYTLRPADDQWTDQRAGTGRRHNSPGGRGQWRRTSRGR